MGDENDRFALERTTNAMIEHVISDVAVYSAQRIVQQVDISKKIWLKRWNFFSRLNIYGTCWHKQLEPLQPFDAARPRDWYLFRQFPSDRQLEESQYLDQARTPILRDYTLK